MSGKWNVTSLPGQAMLVKQCDTREAAAPKDPDMHTDNDRQSLPDRGERVALADTFSSTRHTVQHIESIELVSTRAPCASYILRAARYWLWLLRLLWLLWLVASGGGCLWCRGQSRPILLCIC